MLSNFLEILALRIIHISFPGNKLVSTGKF